MFHVEFFCEVGPKTAIYLQFQYAYIVFHVVINFTSRVPTECEPKGHLRVGMHNTDDKQLAYFIHLLSYLKVRAMRGRREGGRLGSGKKFKMPF